jgi:polyhydroxybutyrate depolymerase
MIRALPAVALVFALFAVACGGSDGDSDAAPATTELAAAVSSTPLPVACTPARTHAAGETPSTLATGTAEDERQFLLSVPESYTGEQAVPLVFVFHEDKRTAQDVSELTGFAAAAGERGWITVFPEATGQSRSWNYGASAAAADDAVFISNLTGSLKEALCIDPKRVYATGYSNGGAMALRAACDLGGVFAAVAPVAATYPVCQAAVPIVAFHGSLDEAVPYEGGGAAGEVPLAPVHKSVAAWASAIGCDALPVIARAAADVELATYARCPLGDGEALMYTVLNGGHTWPGALIDYPVEEAGVTTHAISATQLILDFFETHPQP